jgi:hypothetical protein
MKMISGSILGEPQRWSLLKCRSLRFVDSLMLFS